MFKVGLAAQLAGVSIVLGTITEETTSFPAASAFSNSDNLKIYDLLKE
jgi:hypothetical protein